MSKHSTWKEGLPGEVRAQLARAGDNLRTARRRRGMTIEHVAKALSVDPKTIRRLEGGEPGVSRAVEYGALWLYGLLNSVVEQSAPTADDVGTALEVSRLPKRVRARDDF